MFLSGLMPGEQGPSAENPDTHLSRSSQVQGSSGQGCGGGGLQMWRGCSQVSEALWVGVGVGVEEGQGMCLWELQSAGSSALQQGIQTLTSPGAVRSEVQIATDVVDDGCRCEEAVPRSLGLCG